ncbi:hypothetical protein ACFT7S_38310 [Streptomyces sp. NPDC057136]|uniref:hypothetical protein n=1 Tax=Streptomyces sp. NPDC057136 TaxID=3346029 RepID=UPI00362826F9
MEFQIRDRSVNQGRRELSGRGDSGPPGYTQGAAAIRLPDRRPDTLPAGPRARRALASALVLATEAALLSGQAAVAAPAQLMTVENTALKERLRHLSQDKRTLEDRLQAARSNTRFLDRRISQLEAQLLERDRS